MFTKKKSSFFISLALVLGMLVSCSVPRGAVSNTKEEDSDSNTPPEVPQAVFTQDFSTDILNHDPAWTLFDSKISDSVFRSTSETSLQGLNFRQQTKSFAVNYIEFDLKLPQKNPASNGLFFGLRLIGENADPRTAYDGLWIHIRNGSLSVMSGEWPKAVTIKTGYDFVKNRRVFVEDDPANKRVTVLFADDKGKKQKIAQITIDGQMIQLISAGEGGKQSLDLGYQLEDKGYMNWRTIEMEEIELDNIKVQYPDLDRAPYVAADPLNYRDVYSDTWVATDDLDRSTPLYDEVGDPKDKKVGAFYFLWHEKTGIDIYDHNATYLSGGIPALEKVMKEGPLGEPHYWAEPYFGYYRSDDPWVIRKHANMLTEAGIDFIFFDCSNNYLYPHIYQAIFSEYEKMRKEGLDTPQIAFFMGDRPEFGANMMPKLWEDIYKDNYYSDLWFRVYGKPLVLGNLLTVDKELSKNFTVRRSWAFNGWTTDGMGKWPWIAEYPQIPGKKTGTLIIEQLTVACGFHATTSRGRSFHKGVQPTDGRGAYEFELATTGEGLAYNEQWSRVWDVNPKYVMLTGWNEWWAGRWNTSSGEWFANTYKTDQKDPAKSNFYVDCFNPEFSRDLEPMKGGFGDNYYYQTVQNVRKFKGTRPIPAAFGQKTIQLDKGFEQWNPVGPEYRDTVADVIHRKHGSNVGNLTYTNTTGRNDFVTAKVSQDAEHWYFYVETVNDIVIDNGSNWMNLFVNADQSSKTGWEGYNYVINRSRKDGKMAIEQNKDNKWAWEKIGEASFELKGNQLQIAVPKNVLKLSNEGGFDFKWADNSVVDGAVMDFVDKGDTAPNSRFNYRYTTKSQEVKLSDDLKSLLGKESIALKANSYEAYLGSQRKIIDTSSTRNTPIGIDGVCYIPKAFIAQNTNLKLDSLKAKIINTVEYVSVEDVAKIWKKSVTYGEKGLVIISNTSQWDEQFTQELIAKL